MYWSVLLLEVSAIGPELHLDVSALQRSVLLLEVSATGPELHLYVSALTQRSVLLMECGYLYIIIYTKNSYRVSI